MKAFGKNADFVQRYLQKGTKIAVEGRIETGSYTNKDGKKVYTTDVIVERHEFVESKAVEQPRNTDSFVNVPDSPEFDEELPFR